MRQPNPQKEARDDRRAHLPARPGGSTGTSRARRGVSREGTPRRARVSPVDYRDGLSRCLTNTQETDITTIIQRRSQHPRRSGRDQSEQLVAIRRNEWSRSSECAEHFAQSFVRMYKIATTPPYGPVMMSLDAGLQQEPIRENNAKLYIPRFVSSSPPQGDSGAVREAARLLASAERPVIVVDRAARTPTEIKLLVELAETLQAPVVDLGGRMNFPKTHYLSLPANIIGQADVIIGMELSDFWGVVNSYIDNGDDGVGVNEPKTKPNTRLVSINSVELNTKANYQDFQRFLSVDVSMPADAEATLPALVEAVKSAIPDERRAAISRRGEAYRKTYAKVREASRQAAAIAWDASPISTARLVMEIWGQIETFNWSLVSSSGNVSDWPNRLWPMEQHHQWLGGSGGYGVGYGAPASVGAALANRDLGRFSVSIQSDGDLMYAPGVLWTAARHKIPLLAVMRGRRASSARFPRANSSARRYRVQGRCR